MVMRNLISKTTFNLLIYIYYISISRVFIEVYMKLFPSNQAQV